MVKTLLAGGADVDAKEKDNGETAIDIARQQLFADKSKSKGYRDVVQMLKTHAEAFSLSMAMRCEGC